MRLNELYKKQSLDKTVFDSGDKVYCKGEIGTVLSYDGKAYKVKFKDGVASRASNELRLATPGELK